MSDRATSGHARGDQVILGAFSGGMDRSVAPNFLPDDVARLIVNAYYRRESQMPRTRPGLAAPPWWTVLMDGAATPALKAVKAVEIFTATSGTTYVVAAVLNAQTAKQELWYINPAATSPVAVQLSADLGATTLPMMRQFYGALYVAVAGQTLKRWNGVDDDEGARETGTITVVPDNGVPGPPADPYNPPDNGDTLTVGDTTWTFRAARQRPLEITIGASATATAANIKAALDLDSLDVRAEIDAQDDTVVNLTARETGDWGKRLATTCAQTTEIDLSGGTMANGADGRGFDVVDTYDAPQGGLLTVDRHGRLVCSGDPSDPSQIFFCAPGIAWDWATGDYGDGEQWPLGGADGNTVSALAPFLDEIWAHKSGQNREIYRMRVADPEPATWDLLVRPYSDIRSAAGARCAVSAGPAHLVLDTDWLGIYEGTATYDEIRAGLESAKVDDLLVGTVRASAFLTLHPAAGVVLIFPAAGSVCLVYHYGSRRWTFWKFSGGLTLTCAVWCEALQTMIFGASDGSLYVLDETIATDAGAGFATIMESRAYGSESLAQLVAKSILCDYQHLIAGRGRVYAIVNRNDQDKRLLGEFELQNVSLTILAGRTVTILAAASIPLSSRPYGRIVNHSAQVAAESIAFRIELESGAFVFQQLAVRASVAGRAVA